MVWRIFCASIFHSFARSAVPASVPPMRSVWRQHGRMSETAPSIALAISAGEPYTCAHSSCSSDLHSSLRGQMETSKRATSRGLRGCLQRLKGCLRCGAGLQA